MKAITLLSGGLDSILATRLILEQGVEVEAINFLTVFCTCTARGKTCLAGKSAAKQLGIRLKVFEVSRDFFEIVKNPRHGYGSNLNPCLDCRILMFKKAARYMRQIGASFLITGEVLGERPMSQRRQAMRIIEKESELNGLILRPLSAKLLEPTIPETKGLVDREKLLSIAGRSRRPQMQLARQLGINDYPCPAGGCLLTDTGFAERMRDLIQHKPDFTVNDVRLLKSGRYFRLHRDALLIVGRNESENNKLLNLAQENDLCFYPARAKGPVGIGRGTFTRDCIITASGIIARYSDKNLEQRLEVAYKRVSEPTADAISAARIEEGKLESLRI
jgi:tRNA U34 2-thiouridine synthase MnmA/TrmU